MHLDLDLSKLSAKWPEIPECGSKTSTMPFDCSTFRSFSFGVIQMISCRDWWPWTKPGYITMTRRQITLNGVGVQRVTPPPKIPSANNSWKCSRLDFFSSRRHRPLWLSSKGLNYQRGVLLISAGAIEGYFEVKTPSRRMSPRGLFLHENAPANQALATQKNMAYLGFQCFDHPTYSPNLAPSTTTSSLD
jgi:hypothetical protein